MFSSELKFNNRFYYIRTIGKLYFLDKRARSHIAHATHQCARSCEDTKASHGLKVEQIVRHLNITKSKGLVLNPDDGSFKVCVDSDFCGKRDKLTASKYVSAAKSRTGHVITYASCPAI